MAHISSQSPNGAPHLPQLADVGTTNLKTETSHSTAPPSSIPYVLGFRTMLALEIWLNGKKICTAGIQERGVITSLTACIIRPEHSWCEFDVGGLIGRTDEHLEWAKEELAVGSEVTIKVVNADVADAPKSRQQLKSS